MRTAKMANPAKKLYIRHQVKIKSCSVEKMINASGSATRYEQVCLLNK